MAACYCRASSGVKERGIYTVVKGLVGRFQLMPRGMASDEQVGQATFTPTSELQRCSNASSNDTYLPSHHRNQRRSRADPFPAFQPKENQQLTVAAGPQHPLGARNFPRDDATAPPPAERPAHR